MVELLQLESLEKVFPNGTIALRGVDLLVRGSTVHGLLGANGAGKSTLIKILSGAQSATAGTILWRGEQVRWKRPSEPKAAGIATLHQHIPLVGTLSVLENVFLGERTLWRRTSALEERLRRLLATVGYDIDGDALVGDLPIGQRQMVGILQALAVDAQLMVMDEPTASLATEEREVVYAAIRRLARQGAAIVFVSHFLDEILALTDEVTVLRDGVAVLHAPTAELDESKLAAAITGRAVVAMVPRSSDTARGENISVPTAPPAIEIDLSSPGKLAPCSLKLRAGEVLGIAGFLGSGRSELLHAIFGSDREARGEVRIGGKPVARSPSAAVKAGVALVPEDRMRQGLISGFSILQNTTLPFLEDFAWADIFTVHQREIAYTEEAIGRLGIKTAGTDVPVADLSGGNAQKVSIAKWLAGGPPRLLLLDEPTAGVDIGAKTQILELIRELASGGSAVIIVSSEFEELLAVCDRILVMREGAIVAERCATEVDEHELVVLAGGRRTS
jgi:ribose transport system ATP-binding protein